MSRRLALLALALRYSALLSLVAIAAGCAQAGQGVVEMGVACGDGATCKVCGRDTDCPSPQKCDLRSHACVGCVGDGDCPGGKICSPVNQTCISGCSVTKGCGDAGVCAYDAGVCYECFIDGDCPTMTKPRCDPTAHACVACLPTKDNCGQGQYCAEPTPGKFTCTVGCKSDTDCNNGADAGTSHSVCDLVKHQCVNCVADTECPLGTICNAGVCTPGCTTVQKCPGTLSCCSGKCSDTTTDFDNCGMCGKPCMGGWNCCGSKCFDPANDTMNCGMCGKVCMAANAVPSCKLRMCAIATCNPGWKDCNNNYNDGCEINTDTNANNCGSCGNPCIIASGTPKCVGGMCDVGSCNLGSGNCNNNPMDGCETDTFNDAMNCGMCGKTCTIANGTGKCVTGGCQVATCDAGWEDCNNNPTDGCETNLATSATNCGVCKKVCSTTGGTASCMGSQCMIACNPGFGNCNNVITDGCEANFSNNKDHCGSCAKDCDTGAAAIHVATTGCAGGLCTVGTCVADYYDVDNADPNGCECAGVGPINVCGSPIDLGSLGVGASATPQTGNIPGSGARWYRVTFPTGSFNYHPRASFSVNPNSAYRFDVFTNCSSSPVNGCTTGGDVGSSVGLISWEQFNNCTGGCTSLKPGAGTLYIRVFRVGAVTCGTYTLNVSG